MIQENDVTIFGRFTKTHGISGELLLQFEGDALRLWEQAEGMIICRIEGIMVPFFVERERKRGNRSILVKLEGVDSREQAERLCFCEAGVIRKAGTPPPRFLSAGHPWTGYTLCDTAGTAVGRVIDVDESTENTLLLVDTGERTFLFPAAAALILSSDDTARTLTAHIPEGLCEL